MKLTEEEFWEAVENFKSKDSSGEQLELWLTHGLPIYSNSSQLLRIYEDFLSESDSW